MPQRTLDLLGMCGVAVASLPISLLELNRQMHGKAMSDADKDELRAALSTQGLLT